MAQDGRRRELNRPLLSTRATPAPFPTPPYRPLRILEAHLTDLMALSAPVWPARRIVADGDETLPPKRAKRLTTNDASFNALSAQTHSNRNMTGHGTKNHFTCLSKSGSAHPSAPSLWTKRQETRLVCIATRRMYLQNTVRSTTTALARKKALMHGLSIVKTTCGSICD